MRTTVTLEEDVAAKLQREVRRTGLPFKEVLNEAVRRGLMPPAVREVRESFQVRARSLGGLCPGVQIDNIAELLDQLEGPTAQ